MKRSILFIALLSGVLFAAGSGPMHMTGKNADATPQEGMSAQGHTDSMTAGHGWSAGETMGTGMENAQGEVTDPGQGWSTQEGVPKGSEDSNKNN